MRESRGPGVEGGLPARDAWQPVVAQAATRVNLALDDPAVIRAGSNVMIRARPGVVARIGRRGSVDAARRQLTMARWLHRNGLNVISEIEIADQPTLVDGYPVTWWNLAPPHRHATPAELASVLRALHAIPIPDEPRLDPLDPFVGLDGVADHQAVLREPDRAWLRSRVADLRHEYAAVLPQLNQVVVHGDAWQGNVIVPDGGGDPILIDLEHVAVGPRDWDFTLIGVDHADFSRLTAEEYDSFVGALDGYDVTQSPAFGVLATIAELRWTAFAIRRSGSDPALANEVRHRLDCLTGQVPKPWTWTAT